MEKENNKKKSGQLKGNWEINRAKKERKKEKNHSPFFYFFPFLFVCTQLK